MLKFFRSLCPAYRKDPTDPCGGQHRFAFEGTFPDGKTGVCTGCGIAARDLDTIWDKIEYWYWGVVPYHLRPKNLWYSFKCWAWKRYTTTKPRTLNHEWYDRDGLLEHTIIEIARGFIEKEGPKTEEEWAWQKEHNPEFHASWLETKEIIDWWLARGEDYPWDMPNEEFDSRHPWIMPTVEEYTGTKDERRSYERLMVEDKHKAEIREKLKRIIDISPYYWT